jgi:nitrogen fixation-related uncharacterized protein
MFSIITSRYGMALAALVAGAILFWGYGVKRYYDGKAACRVAAIEKELKDHEKLEQVRAVSRDVGTTVSRMRSGTF